MYTELVTFSWVLKHFLIITSMLTLSIETLYSMVIFFIQALCILNDRSGKCQSCKSVLNRINL